MLLLDRWHVVRVANIWFRAYYILRANQLVIPTFNHGDVGCHCCDVGRKLFLCCILCVIYQVLGKMQGEQMAKLLFFTYIRKCIKMQL